eukprot:COSAG02_NODE_44024_length_369_cov_1.318519_1_plen_59_part_01
MYRLSSGFNLYIRRAMQEVRNGHDSKFRENQLCTAISLSSWLGMQGWDGKMRRQQHLHR